MINPHNIAAAVVLGHPKRIVAQQATSVERETGVELIRRSIRGESKKIDDCGEVIDQ